MYYTSATGDGSPGQKTYYDLLGRERFIVTENISGAWTCIEKRYDELGRVILVSEPYFENETPSQWTAYTYYDDGRPHFVYYPTHTEEITYSGRQAATTNTSTQISRIEKVNSWGEAEEVTDPGGTIVYTYYSSGLPKDITAPDGSAFHMEYDEYGRQTLLTDPDAKNIDYIYNAYGELESQTDEKGNNFTMVYDQLGRIVTKNSSDGSVIQYNYITEGNGKGLPESISYSNGIVYNYAYDELSRLASETETIDGQDYTYNYNYDTYGNLKDMVYPTGFTVRNGYTKGYLTSVTRTDIGTVMYSNPEYNARGQIKRYRLGNGLTMVRDYDAFGFPSLIQAGGVQWLTCQFDPETGNLEWRKDNLYDLQEDFDYDGTFKNRLETWQPDGQEFTASYYPNGNIFTKSDAGVYEYDFSQGSPAGGPHSVSKITDAPSFPVEMLQHIDYTAFNKVKTITHYNQAYEMDFTYGPDYARKKTVTLQGDPSENGSQTMIEKRIFAGGGYEVETDKYGNERKIHYIAGGDGLLAVYIIDRGRGALYYAHKDHLGSLYALTDEAGSIATYKDRLQVFSFDPWGRRRNPFDWTFTGVTSDYLVKRGFTGHEHLERFGLINMNGRMYDPLVGRFLSPDNYVQAPDNSQTFNRYSYCLNNPLVYTDPDGEWVHLVVAAVIGGTMNWMMNGAEFSWDGLKYFGVGALSGALGAGIGAGIGGIVSGAGHFSFMVSSSLDAIGVLPGVAVGASSGFTSGFISGVGNSLIQGNNLKKSIGDGFNSGAWGASIGGSIGGLAGGIKASKLGYDIFTGGPKRIKPITYKYQVFNSIIEIKDGCFSMTMDRLDPNHDANYYQDLVNDFFVNRGIKQQSMKNIYLEDFFNFANIDAEKIGWSNSLISSPPPSGSSVFGYGIMPNSKVGHAMPVTKFKFWPSTSNQPIPKFKVIFNNHGNPFAFGRFNIDLGFQFWRLRF